MKKYMLLICLMAFTLLLGTGCQSTFGPLDPHSSKVGLVTQEHLRSHVIHVDRDGDFYEIPEQGTNSAGVLYDQPIYKWAATDRARKDLHEKQNEEMTNAYQKIFAGIDDFAKDHDKSKPLKVSIVIHGGLSTPEAVLEEELEILPKMLDDDVYPIFINWRSGAASTLKDHFFRIRDGEVTKTAKWTSPIYIIGYTCKTIGEIPLAYWRSLRDHYKSTPQDISSNVPPPTGWDAQGRYHFDPAHSDDYSYKWGESLLYPFGYIGRIPLTPLIFSLGTPAWDGMQRRCHVMFVGQNDLYTTTDVLGSGDEKAWWTEKAELEEMVEPQYTNNAQGAVYVFSKMLSHGVETGRWENIQINLIGHSMGSIIVNRMLKTAPDLPVSNIVHMASADNLQNYLDITMEYAKGHTNVSIYNLFLHPRNEYTEKNAGTFVPSGSLLTWIDHTYERPEYVLQRTAGRWENMRKIVKVIDDHDIRDNVHYKVFGRNKKQTCPPQPQKHGEFNDVQMGYWQERFWK